MTLGSGHRSGTPGPLCDEITSPPFWERDKPGVLTTWQAAREKAAKDQARRERRLRNPQAEFDAARDAAGVAGGIEGMRRARYRTRRELGLCVTCGIPSRPARCEDCAERDRERVREYRVRER